MKFSHIALRVHDVDAMLAFYCGVLGFSEAFRIPNDDGSLRIVYVHLGDGQYLELCLGGGERSAFDDAGSVGVRHMCFSVSDIAAQKAQMEQAGVSFDSEILSLRDGNKAAYLRDPDGNKIELVEIQPGSPQHTFEAKHK